MRMMRAPVTRKRANLLIDVDLVSEARPLGINLSRAAEAGIAAEVKRAKEAQWLEENRDAIAAWNRWVAENKLPFEDLHAWR